MRSPRVKRAHDPVRFADGRIRIGSVQYGVGAEMRDDAQGTVWRILELMDGTRSPEAIVETVAAERPEMDPTSIEEGVRTLLQSGFVEDAAAEIADGLDPEEIERYARSENYFSWIDTSPRARRMELQARLKRSRVVLIGLGGSGSAVAASLVAAGAGALRCVDFDRVELSNLNRQTLYDEADVGAPKVARAVERLRRMNRHVEVTGMERRIASEADAADVLAGFDLGVLCADAPHPDVERWTNAAALALRIPWSMCYYAGPMLTTGIFVPFETPCYRCMEETAPNPLRAEGGEVGRPLYGGTLENAAIAPTAALTGHLGALEAIYFLAGLRPQTVGRIFHQNLLIYDHSYFIEPRFVPGCPACGGGRQAAPSDVALRAPAGR